MFNITTSRSLPAGECVSFSFASSRWGDLLFASTRRGLCALTFAADRAEALSRLAERFPHASLAESHHPLHDAALRLIESGSELTNELPLHLVGTPFRIAVWQALLRVPRGETASYGDLAAMAGRPAALRATGTAVGANPIAILIPCHCILPAGSIGRPLTLATVGRYFHYPELKLALLLAEVPD